MKQVRAIALFLAVLLTTFARPASAAPSNAMVRVAADSLIARHINATEGGWTWRSAIQAPHLQTDRDVGAASVAMGFIAAWQTTGDARYLAAAAHAGDWLLAIAQPVAGGLRWPDYEDSPGRISTTHFTSFDDGAAGITDILWRLASATHDMRYARASVSAMTWLESRAEGDGGHPCPQVCRWRWTDSGATIYTGMGEGNAGVAYAFDSFAQRTGDRSYERYALGAAAYLQSLTTQAGAIPEQPNTTAWNTGYLSGSAGDAFLFLRLFQRTGDARYFVQARRLLAWVRSKEKPQPVGIAWPIMIDPNQGDNNQLATGIEEGSAGIGWVELQAFKITRDPIDLQTAVATGDWLLSVAMRDSGGLQWQEDYHRPFVNTALDNGAPGIGWFLDDLYRATGDARYERAALGAQTWLTNVAMRDDRGIYWYENRSGPPGKHEWRIARDPSWHWGIAGIGAFYARMAGWPEDMPGEQPGL